VAEDLGGDDRRLHRHLIGIQARLFVCLADRGLLGGLVAVSCSTW
jgi:hypothetical protein